MCLHSRVIYGIQQNMLQESHAESSNSIRKLTVAVKISSINHNSHIQTGMNLETILPAQCQPQDVQ
jgi:hypothetical protein